MALIEVTIFNSNIQLGANVDNIDSQGITPLMWAAKRD